MTDAPTAGEDPNRNDAPAGHSPADEFSVSAETRLEDSRSAVTRDAFLDGSVMLLQPKRGYRAGIDAVFLAAAAQPQEGRSRLTVLDAGAGVGTVGLLAAYRLRKQVDVHATLVELSPELAILAERNVRDNALHERVRVVCADFMGSAADLEANGLAREGFDLVLSNPPFHIDAHGTMSANAIKAGAHAMGEGDLERWARAMARATRPGGEIVVVHKAEALPGLLAVLVPRFGALRIMPLYPRSGEPASRILIKGVKGSRAPLTLLPGGVLHGEGNAFTSAATAILRHGAGLWL
ncbi:MAG: tRNA1(Val) (adenine(37)-N6)-methyltransferase [Hyphomicrobiaceae bacterium]